MLFVNLQLKALEKQINFENDNEIYNKAQSDGNLRGFAGVKESRFSKRLYNQDIINDRTKARQYRLLRSVELEIINNCDYDAYAFLIFEKENLRTAWQWQRITKGDSFTINEVDKTNIWIYGINAINFSDVWKSDSSEYCFAPGNCFRLVDISAIQGRGERVQYFTCETLSFDAFKAPPAPLAANGQQGTHEQHYWLDEHNTRRRTFYSLFPQKYGLDSSPLKWSESLAASAQNYANKLIELEGCQGQHGYEGDSYGGENLAWNIGTKARNPAEVLTAWYDNEIDIDNMQLIGMKYHASQVVFRSSRYLGCGQAEKQINNRQSCYIQVCRYISPGNCFLPKELTDYFPDECIEDYPNSEWVCSALSDSASVLCAQENELCPHEGCF